MSRARAGLKDRWLQAVIANTEIGDACKVTLFALGLKMTDAGYTSVPRETVAKIVGKHPTNVSKHIAEAKAAGLLDQIGGGYRGRTAQYAALLPGEKVSADRVPLRGERAPLSAYLSPPNGERSARTQYARGSSETRQLDDRATVDARLWR